MKPIILKITDEWIKEKAPCQEALDWWSKKNRKPMDILNELIEAKKYSWANWFIVRIMAYEDYVSYAVFAAEQVIDIYEKKYPNDKRPRQAIEAAKKCIKDPSKENKEAARAAWAAAEAAWAAEAAAEAAGAARAAWAAAWAAWAVGAVEVTGAAEAAEAAMQKKILDYGIKLLRLK